METHEETADTNEPNDITGEVNLNTMTKKKTKKPGNTAKIK